MTSIGRRRFLLLGASGATAAVVRGSTAAAAEPATANVWRLSADWGYPAGPKARTRCRCRACRINAANKLFLSRDVAVAARIHPCCVCQPVSVELLAADVAALGALIAGGSADLRDPAVRAAFSEAVARASSPVATLPGTTGPGTTTPSTTTPSTTAPTTTAPLPGATPATPPSGSPQAGLVSERPASSESTAGASGLPATGLDATTAIAIGAVALAAGGALVAAAGRSADDQAAKAAASTSA